MSPQFANPQALLVSWLRTQFAASDDELLAGVVVGAAVPATRTSASGPLLVVRRSGGVAKRPVLDRPRIDFMHWHATEFQATGFANLTRAFLLYDLPGQVVDGHTVYRPVEFAGPAPYPDPAGSIVPIVMFTMEIPVRVTAEVAGS